MTIDDIIAREGGVRSPEVADSPKEFDLAFMVVQDGPYNDAAYAYFSLLSYHLMGRSGPEDYDNLAPFYWATGERATLNTRLPVDLPEPQGLPGQPVPTSTPGSPTAPPSSPGPSFTPAMTSASGGEGNPSEPPTTAPPPSTPTPLREGLARCGVLPLGIVVLAAAARSRQPDRVTRRRT